MIEMFACTRLETKMVMEGRASGVVRKYGDSCPHFRGEKIVLTSKFLDLSGRSIPFAKVEVMTVRPGSIGEFRRDPFISQIDGYDNGEHWMGQMRMLYPGTNEDEKVFHIKFNVVELDRDAGRRGDKS